MKFKLPRLALVLLSASLLPSGCRDSGSSNEVTIDRFREVEDFDLIDQQSEPLGRSHLLGKVWVADFVFTSCATECLILSYRMGKLQERFADRDEVAFVSFSVDPQTDKPERLADYADKWSANAERWHFLTGQPDELETLIKQSFLLPVARSPKEQANLNSSDLIHSNKFAIVDREGVVRAYVDGLEPDAIEQTSEIITKLLEEESAPPPAATPASS